MAIFLPCIFPQCEDSQSLDTKLKLMSDIKLEMEALMGEIKTKIHNNTIQLNNILHIIVIVVTNISRTVNDKMLKNPTV